MSASHFRRHAIVLAQKDSRLMTPSHSDEPVFDDVPSVPDVEDPEDHPEFTEDAPTTPARGPVTNPTGHAVISVKRTFDQRQSLAPMNEIISLTTTAVLDALDPTNRPAPHALEAMLLGAVNGIIKSENQKVSESADKHQRVKALTHWQVAQILLRLHHVIRIAPSAKDTDREYDLLAMYRSTGATRGTYTTSEDDIRTTARRYNTALTTRDFNEVLAVLREDAPRRHQSTHRDLITSRDGIVFYGTEPETVEINGKTFDFSPKDIHPFDPAIVLTIKNGVSYPGPEHLDPVWIHNEEDGTDWEVVDWLNDMFDLPDGRGEGLADLIWEIIGAVIRPHVRWGKTAWFYSEVGNNGKGTLCALMRNLLGSGAHTSIPLSDFGKQFALEPLVRANAIIVDENDVGSYIDKAANMKAIVTNDIIQIDRKYRAPIAFQFFGFMVQCLNEFPLFRDKSESFYRRQLFVPFEKSFTGAERKYIKDDYLQRPEVLEYVFWYAINRAGAEEPGNYYRLSEPAPTQKVLDEYKESNDPVRTFWDEYRLEFVWDLLPFTFAYDLFKAWSAKVNPSGKVISQKSFITDLVAIVRKDPLWSCEDKTQRHRPGTRMDKPEPLIVEYDLRDWKNPLQNSQTPAPLARAKVLSQYRGLTRNLGVPQDVLSEELAHLGAAPEPEPIMED